MIRASSSGDHLLCFLAGESAARGGIARLALPADPGATGEGPYGCEAGRSPVVAVVAAVREDWGDAVGFGGGSEDSSESDASRSDAISTVDGCSV